MTDRRRRKKDADNRMHTEWCATSRTSPEMQFAEAAAHSSHVGNVEQTPRKLNAGNVFLKHNDSWASSEWSQSWLQSTDASLQQFSAIIVVEVNRRQ